MLDVVTLVACVPETAQDSYPQTVPEAEDLEKLWVRLLVKLEPIQFISLTVVVERSLRLLA